MRPSYAAALSALGLAGVITITGCGITQSEYGGSGKIKVQSTTGANCTLILDQSGPHGSVNITITDDQELCDRAAIRGAVFNATNGTASKGTVKLRVTYPVKNKRGFVTYTEITRQVTGSGWVVI